MKEATKQSMSLFFRMECYTAENLAADYLAEVRGYSDASWEAPQRAARLSAAVKRYKTSEMLCFIFGYVAPEADPDFTPLVVKRLCNALFGRTGSQSIIVAVFGEKGRQHRSTDSHPAAIEALTARYRHAAELHWRTTLQTIARVKRTYKTEIKASRDTET